MMQDLSNEPTRPASGLPYDDYLSLIPPPPPPPRKSKWKLAILVALALLVLAASTSAAYLLGIQQGRTMRSSSTPIPSATPTAATGVASPDRYAFARALGEALAQADTISILPAVETTGFIIDCNPTVNSTGAGCYASWNDLQGQIATGGISIDLLTQGLDLANTTSSLSDICQAPLSIGGSFLLIGTFSRDQPYPNTGLAILAISHTGLGAVTTWVWTAAFFC